MKHTFLLTALSALLFSTTSQAQVPGVSKVTKALPKVDLGIKAGANFNQMSGGTTWKQSYKPGIVGGVFVGVTKNKIGVQAEGLLRSAKLDATIGGVSVKTLSLDVPVLFEYKLVSRLWVQVGPQYSQILTAKDNSSTDVKNAFKTSDVSGVLGLQVKLPVHLVAGARYILGFSDANNTSSASSPVPAVSGAWHNRAIQAYVGFRFL